MPLRQQKKHLPGTKSEISVKRSVSVLLLLFLSFALFAQTKPDAVKEYKAKNYDSAVDICLDEIKSGKYTVDTYNILLWSLNRQKRYKETIAHGNQGLKKYRDMRIIESMGVAYYYTGNYPNQSTDLYLMMTILDIAVRLKRQETSSDTQPVKDRLQPLLVELESALKKM